MSTVAPKAPEMEVTARRKRHTWLIVLGVVLVVAVVAVGTWAIIETDRIDLATATEVADEWTEGWNATDGEAVAALYVEDGIHRDPEMIIRGRDRIVADVEDRGQGLSNAQRTSELNEMDTGAFRYTAQYDFDGNETWAGVVELEFEGDLLVRSEWLYWSQVRG